VVDTDDRSIIDNAFPGLSKEQRQILKDSSKQVDSDQSQAGSYKHGLSSDDNDPYSSTGAYNPTYATNDFIEQNEHNAKEIQAEWIASGHTGISPAALAAFGNAATQSRMNIPTTPRLPRITGLVSFGCISHASFLEYLASIRCNSNRPRSNSKCIFDTLERSRYQATHEKVNSYDLFRSDSDAA